MKIFFPGKTPNDIKDDNRYTRLNYFVVSEHGTGCYGFSTETEKKEYQNRNKKYLPWYGEKIKVYG